MSDPSCVKELHSPRVEVIVSALLWLRDDKMCRELVWKKWLPAETWVSVITMSGLIDSNVFTIDTIKFNRALIRSKGKLDGPSMDQGNRQSFGRRLHLTLEVLKVGDSQVDTSHIYGPLIKDEPANHGV